MEQISYYLLCINVFSFLKCNLGHTENLETLKTSAYILLQLILMVVEVNLGFKWHFDFG